jgi:hypothetical protein
MRLVCPLALAVGMWACAPALAAQVERGGFVSLAGSAGIGELVESRSALHAAYTVRATAPTGVTVGARYTAGIHRLGPDRAGYLDEHGSDRVAGGEGSLRSVGVDLELGVAMGPVRPYAFSGYHFLVQTVDSASVGVEGGAVELPAHRRHGFSPGRGYGLALGAGPAGIFAERFRGGGRDGVLRVRGTRFGVTYVVRGTRRR